MEYRLIYTTSDGCVSRRLYPSAPLLMARVLRLLSHGYIPREVSVRGGVVSVTVRRTAPRRPRYP